MAEAAPGAAPAPEQQPQLPAKRPQGRPRKHPMSEKERQRKLAEIDEQLAAYERKIALLKEQDPYWFYTPSDGKIPDDGRRLLEKYLLPDDIPQRLPGQIDALKSLAPIRLVGGGNRSGKSTVLVIDTIIRAIGQVPIALENVYPKEKIPTKFPRYYRVVGEDYANGILKSLIPLFKFWVPREYLVEGSWEKSYSEKRNTLMLGKKGQLLAEIEFMSNQQDVGSFQGSARHGIRYDEEPREDIRRENLMRMTTNEGIDELYGMTPTKGLTWVADKLAYSEKDEGGQEIDFIKLPSVTNPKVNFEALDMALREISDYSEVKMRLLGEFVSLSGLIYGGVFDKKVHVIPPFPVGCTCGAPGGTHDSKCPWLQFYVVRGMDWHLATDIAVVWMALDALGNRYVVKCLRCTPETTEAKAKIVEHSAGMRMGWTVVDRSVDWDVKAFGGLNILKQLKAAPNALLPLRVSEKFDGSILVGVDTIKKDMRINPATKQPALFFFDTPNVRELVHSIRTLERDTYANEDKKGPKDKILEGKHHLHAAFRYLYQYPLRWVPAVDAVPQQQFGDEALLI